MPAGSVEPTPTGGIRWWLVVGVAVLATVAAAGWVAFARTDNTAGRRPSPVPTERSVIGGADCPTDRDHGLPTGPLPAVRWRPLAVDVPVRLPTSTRYGPCRITATTATGYAHTPGGAVVAAIQILARASVPGPIGQETIEAQIVAGPWRDILAESVAATEPDAAAGVGVAIAGFAVAAFDRSTATISVAVRVDQIPGRYVVFAADLVWQDGDWRVNPPVGGDWDTATSLVVALPAGFVEWGP